MKVLTFVHAGFVEVFRENEGFGFVLVSRRFDDGTELVEQRITDLAKRRLGSLFVGDNGFLDELAAREAIEIVARVH